MTDTLAQEAPAAPKKGMSEAHKAKLKAGREAALAKKRAAQATTTPVAVVSPSPAPVAAPPSPDMSAEIERLKSELAKYKPDPAVIAALPNWECYVEFVADKRDDNGGFVGEEIREVEDPRWESLLRYGRPIHGSIVVNALTRNDRGEITSRQQIHGQQFRKADIALAFLRKMKEFGGDVQRVIKA